MDILWLFFFFLLTICLILVTIERWNVLSRGTSPYSNPSPALSPIDLNRFFAFQRNYLIVYCLVNAADWLQGPYSYKLFQSYGFEQSQIASIFLSANVASTFVGTFISSLADTFGRKKLCIIFCLVSILSSTGKFFPNFYMLVAARALDGVSNSLLFSVFESWMVSEHNKRDFGGELLARTFSWCITLNACVAITCGVVASGVVFLAGGETYSLPCGLAIAVVLIAAIIIYYSWDENYGDSKKLRLTDGIISAFDTLTTNPTVMTLGMMQGFYEAGMYMFVFMWTPSLETATHSLFPSLAIRLDFGLTFACLMVSLMLGGLIFGLANKRSQMDTMLLITLYFAAASLSIPAITNDQFCILISFLCFEVSCGIWLPSVGMLRGKYVPEQNRTGLTSMFRVPMNLLLVVVLARVDSLRDSTVFIIASFFCLFAFTIHSLVFWNQNGERKRRVMSVNDPSRFL